MHYRSANMTQQQPRRVYRLFPSLRQTGIAVQHFPKYVKRRYSPHSVDVVLLSVILGGRGQHMLGDEVYDETGSSVAVTHYGQEHDIVTGPEGMEIYNVYLDLRNHPLPPLPERLRPMRSSLFSLHPNLQHHLNRRVRIPIDDPQRFAGSLRRIVEEMDESEPGRIEVIRHCFQIFLIDVCRAAQSNGFIPLVATGEESPAWLEQIRQHLDSEYMTMESLEDMAGRAGVSVTYLCRKFKAHTGKTVTAYRIERQVQAAMWKLREADEKIISIALSCGFNDLAYFNRTFKKLAGVTPSEYRRALRQD